MLTVKILLFAFSKISVNFPLSLKPLWAFFLPKTDVSCAVHAHPRCHIFTVCMCLPQPSWVSVPGLWSSFFAAYTETPGGTLSVSTVLAGGAVLTPWSSLWGLSKVYFSSAPPLLRDSWTVSSLLEVVCFNTVQGTTGAWGRRASCATKWAQRPAGRLMTPSSLSCPSPSWYNSGSPLWPGSDD